MTTILLVEDETLFAMSITEALADAGFRVHCVSEGRRALELAGEVAIDAAIVDLGLPDMDGREVALELRRRCRKLPIFVCSGFDARSINEWAVAAEIVAIEKPIEDERLIGLLEAHAIVAPSRRAGEAPA